MNVNEFRQLRAGEKIKAGEVVTFTPAGDLPGNSTVISVMVLTVSNNPDTNFFVAGLVDTPIYLHQQISGSALSVTEGKIGRLANGEMVLRGLFFNSRESEPVYGECLIEILS